MNFTQRVGRDAPWAALVVAAAIAWSGAASSQATAPRNAVGTDDVTKLGLRELERTFWTCDFLATLHGTGATDAATCSAAYRLLKERKFAGDYDSLLAWWQANKRSEHARLSTIRLSQ